MTSKVSDGLGLGIVEIVEQLGASKLENTNLTGLNENYSKWWREEQAKTVKLQADLLEVAKKSCEKINELEETISNVYANLNLIIQESKKPRYNPKRDIDKIKVLFKNIEKK